MRQTTQHKTTAQTGVAVWPRRAGKNTLAEVAGDYVREAYRAIQKHAGTVDKNDLLEETAQYLQSTFGITDQAAQVAAAQAIGFYLSWDNTVTFDMNHSSSHTVFLRDTSTNRLHCITADELARLLASRDDHLI